MSEQKRFVQVDDLYKMAMLQDPQISPDGQWIAFVRASRDKHRNKARQSIWLVHPDGSGLKQFTSGDSADYAPRWSSDGQKLVFVSDRGDKPQVYLMPVDGGEALPLTYMLNGATDPVWSPDGTQIAFLSSMRPDELDAEDENSELPPASETVWDEHRKAAREGDDERFDPRVVDRLPYRAGTSFWDGRFKHIYVISVSSDVNGERQPRRLTSDARDYSPPEWSVDGRVVYSVASRQPEHDSAWLYNAVVRINLQDATSVEVTEEGWAASSPKPSPDGKWLAFLTRPSTLPLNRFPRLAVMPIEGGQVILLDQGLDRMIERFEWAADSRSLVFTARDGGNIPVYQVRLDGGVPALIAFNEVQVVGLHTGPQDMVAAVTTSAADLCELGLFTPVGGAKQITTLNRHYLDSVDVAVAEHLRYESFDGTLIDGWVLKPPDYEEGKLYPLALNIHGGPSAMWGAHEATMWLEWQHHAANGYVVFFCNPRGSTGCDEAFMLVNHADWGDGPMNDIMAGVDLLIERGTVDPARMAVTGGSYGGYLTAWIIGHSDRFAAAVAQRGVYHLQAFHGTTDIPMFMSSNMKGEPWEAAEIFWEQSPLAYVKQINTPLLILHSENDFRVPIAEGEQLFASLKRLGREVQMVRYPREGHELSRSGEPKHIIDRLERIMGWWDRFIKPAQDV